jgi:hypothetical protein
MTITSKGMSIYKYTLLLSFETAQRITEIMEVIFLVDTIIVNQEIVKELDGLHHLQIG